MRFATTLVGILVVATAAACTTIDSAPNAFDDMTSDSVGCTVEYGDEEAFVVGPLGPTDSETVNPNDYTSFRFARTPESLVVAAKGSDWSSDVSRTLDEVTAAGTVVVKGPFINGDEPGYVATCWRGTA